MGDGKEPPRLRLAGGKGDDADSDSDSSDAFDDDSFAREMLKDAHSIVRFGPIFELLKTGVVTSEIRKMVLQKFFRILAQGKNLDNFYGSTDKATRIFIEELVKKFQDEAIGNTTFGELWSNLPSDEVPSLEDLNEWREFATQRNVVKKPKTPARAGAPSADADSDSVNDIIDASEENRATTEEATEMMRPFREEVERAIGRGSTIVALPTQKFRKWLKGNKSTSFGSTLTDNELVKVIKAIQGKEYAQKAESKGRQYMAKFVDRIARDVTEQSSKSFIRELDLLKDVKIDPKVQPPARAFEDNQNMGKRTTYDEATKKFVTVRAAGAVSSGPNDARDASRATKRRLAPGQLSVTSLSRPPQRRAVSTDFSNSDAASSIGSSVTRSESGSDDDMESSADGTKSESGDDMGLSEGESESGSGSTFSENAFPEFENKKEGEDANGSSSGSFFSAASSLGKSSPLPPRSPPDSKRRRSFNFTDPDNGVSSADESIVEEATFTRNGSPPRKQQRRLPPPIVILGDSSAEDESNVIMLGGSSDNDEEKQSEGAENEDESEAEEIDSSSSEDEGTGRREFSDDDNSSVLPEVLGTRGNAADVDFTSTLAGLERLHL